MSSTLIWLSVRMLLSRSKSLLQGTAWISFAGLVLGVACLVVSMAVMSGFESTLQKSVADVTGHLRVRKPGLGTTEWDTILQTMKKAEPEIQSSLEYAFIEGVIASQGKLSGVLLQGVDAARVEDVLNLKSRIVDGLFQLNNEATAGVLIGKGLALSYGLKPGQEFKIVFPLPSELDPTQFRRKVATFKVAGILDLGKKEFDDRLIIAALPTLQKLAESKISNGLLLKVKNIERAREIGMRLGRLMGSGYQISDWKDINESLFEAVQIERIVVFFVIFIIVVASAFNVSASLYINVVRRYPEIGVLKALGLSKKKVVQMFSLQGLMLGFLGLVSGMILGLIFCSLFSWAESHYSLIPTAVYKLDHIDLSVRFLDIFWISVATLGICFVATLSPSLKGAALSPVEGLKHE
jgi:lipoprotein-releasing system permease protein